MTTPNFSAVVRNRIHGVLSVRQAR